MIRFACLGLFTLMTAACGARSWGDSQPQSIFGRSEFQLIASAERDALARAVLSLQVALTDSEGQRFATPLCTGVAISPHHILTAGHCAKTKLLANPFYAARSADSEQLAILRFGEVLRLSFDGDLDPRSESFAEQGPLLPAAALVVAESDIAVFYQEQAIEAFIDLRTAGGEVCGRPAAGAPDTSSCFVSGSWSLYGYPNGVPLTRSPCAVHRLKSDGSFYHNCDALGGSSGGLIADQFNGQPLALHLAGPGPNSGTYYHREGHFEGPEDFARRRACASSDQSSGQMSAQCVTEKGQNRGISLVKVRDLLQQKAPDLWRSIIDEPHAK